MFTDPYKSEEAVRQAILNHNKRKEDIQMIWIIIGLVGSLLIWYFLIHIKGTKVVFGEWIAIIMMALCAVLCITVATDIFTSYTDTEYSYDDLESHN